MGLIPHSLVRHRSPAVPGFSPGAPGELRSLVFMFFHREPPSLETPMKRKPIQWTKVLQQLFSPRRKKGTDARLALERLDDRITPTITLTALSAAGDTPSGAGNQGSLRYCIQVANATSDNNIIINLQSGGQYNLTRANTLLGFGEQENGNQV